MARFHQTPPEMFYGDLSCPLAPQNIHNSFLYIIKLTRELLWQLLEFEGTWKLVTTVKVTGAKLYNLTS